MFLETLRPWQILTKGPSVWLPDDTTEPQGAMHFTVPGQTVTSSHISAIRRVPSATNAVEVTQQCNGRKLPWWVRLVWVSVGRRTMLIIYQKYIRGSQFCNVPQQESSMVSSSYYHLTNIITTRKLFAGKDFRSLFRQSQNTANVSQE